MRKTELIEALCEMGYDRKELKGMSKEELQYEYDEVTDTSWAHPNESYDDFMDHEDFD